MAWDTNDACRKIAPGSQKCALAHLNGQDQRQGQASGIRPGPCIQPDYGDLGEILQTGALRPPFALHTLGDNELAPLAAVLAKTGRRWRDLGSG